ncbi:MAG: 1-phosphofructokinase, partial [Ruminococcus sp.]|nr:1-phosphofructokinase [Ruminococcus sp.]
LCEIFGRELNGFDEIGEYAQKLQAMGAENVLVSMAGDGALLLDSSGKIHQCGVCKGTVRNSVGAGDSMLAGFIAGLMQGDNSYALKLGTAAGGATAFSDGLATKTQITALMATLV